MLNTGPYKNYRGGKLLNSSYCLSTVAYTIHSCNADITLHHDQPNIAFQSANPTNPTFR